MKKLNWKNLGILLIMLVSLSVTISDFISLVFKSGMYTWFGLFTQIINLAIFSQCYEYMEDKFKRLNKKGA